MALLWMFSVTTCRGLGWCGAFTWGLALVYGHKRRPCVNTADVELILSFARYQAQYPLRGLLDHFSDPAIESFKPFILFLDEQVPLLNTLSLSDLWQSPWVQWPKNTSQIVYLTILYVPHLLGGHTLVRMGALYSRLWLLSLTTAGWCFRHPLRRGPDHWGLYVLVLALRLGSWSLLPAPLDTHSAPELKHTACSHHLGATVSDFTSLIRRKGMGEWNNRRHGTYLKKEASLS